MLLAGIRAEGWWVLRRGLNCTGAQAGMRSTYPSVPCAGAISLQGSGVVAMHARHY
jgi:hypothetical protein